MNTNILKNMADIAKALNKYNFGLYKMTAQSLKSSSGICGASFIHYDCFFIQEAHSEKNYEKMRAKYNKLVEDIIIFV